MWHSPIEGLGLTAETKIAITPERDVEALYVEMVPILLHLAHHKFRVPWADAENLAQEVFTAYLSVMDDVSDAHKWLVGAVCNASLSGRTFQLRSGTTPSEATRS